MKIAEAILQYIANQSGGHTWYTLDRALAGHFDASSLLLPALRQLAQDGLVEARGAASIPGYWITEKGIALLLRQPQTLDHNQR